MLKSPEWNLVMAFGHEFCYSIIPIYTAYHSLGFPGSFAFFEIIEQNMMLLHIFCAHFHSYAPHVIQMFMKQNLHWFQFSDSKKHNISIAQLSNAVVPRKARWEWNELTPGEKSNKLICQTNMCEKFSFLAQAIFSTLPRIPIKGKRSTFFFQMKGIKILQLILKTYSVLICQSIY